MTKKELTQVSSLKFGRYWHRWLDLENDLIAYLAHSKAMGRTAAFTVSHITSNFNRDFDLNLPENQFSSALETLEAERVVKREKDHTGQEVWSLVGYKRPIRKVQSAHTSKKYRGIVKYTKKGQVNLKPPKALVERLGKPAQVTYEMNPDQTGIVVKPDSSS